MLTIIVCLILIYFGITCFEAILALLCLLIYIAIPIGLVLFFITIIR